MAVPLLLRSIDTIDHAVHFGAIDVPGRMLFQPAKNPFDSEP
ncbi:MAG TPA: hypothetical protein VIG89_09200 [Candidatus Acidoferrales bacterium]